MVSVVGQIVLPAANGYKAWEDPSFFKWKKRDAHVQLHCHESVEGEIWFTQVFLLQPTIILTNKF